MDGNNPASCHSPTGPVQVARGRSALALTLALSLSAFPPAYCRVTSAWSRTVRLPGRLSARCEVFLGSMGLLTSPKSARRQVSGYVTCGFAYTSPYTLTPGQPSPGRATLLRHPFSLPTTSLGRTINRISPEGLPGVRCLASLASALAHLRGPNRLPPERRAFSPGEPF
jgi:hypothetical protein